MNAQRKTRKRPRATPLRPLLLRSAPFAKRALAWSPDAELAVAADDSVYVFVPQFGGDEDEEGVGGEVDGGDDEDGYDNDDDDGDDDDDNDDNDDMPMLDAGDGYDPLATTETETRSQFSAGSLHIPVSHPPLDVRVNQRLYAAAGLRFPFGRGGGSDRGGGGDEGGVRPEAERQETRPRGAARGKDRGKAKARTQDSTAAPARDSSHYRRPGGAGAGPLTAVAGTMNSVAAIGWSPAGVGRNRRAVLAVLTSAGVVAVYGEGEDGGEDGPAGSRGRRPTRHYDTSRWEVLWGVGERLVVPPQTQMGECVVSFAWSGPLEGETNSSSSSSSSTRALLLYRTDQDEVVVLRVGRAAAAWHVSEAARFAAAGPHTPASTDSTADAHFVPGGTSFGLRCSPWLVREDAGDGRTAVQVCLVGYLARNYVGFRRVTVRTTRDASGKDETAVEVDVEDVDGLCLFLGTDAFLEWEDGIWTVDDSGGGSRVCRGVVATPLVARPFEVVLLAAEAARGPPPPHHVGACGTAYPSAEEARTNPIQDLVIHPPTADHGPPAYTLVRLSATATNDDWYETGGGPPAQALDAPAAWPQWTLDVARKIKVSGTPGVGEDEGEDEDEPEAEVLPDDGVPVDPRLELDHKPPAPLRLAATTDPELYLHRARLWGLALAPGGGGGVTAVLVTEHAAQQVDRGGWYRDRSRVLFGWPDRAATTTTVAPGPSHVTRFYRPPVSTEARMWSCMYGRGPPVLPAVHSRPPTSLPAAAAAAAVQACAICGAPIDGDGMPPGGDALATCARGHVFDRCGATGLAIQRPGASRVCGVCGSRTLRADAVAAALRQAVAGDVCGRCGGKFHD